MSLRLPLLPLVGIFAARRGSPERYTEQSPVRLLLTLAALVFAAEAGVMGLLALLPPQPALAEALLDSVLLTTLVFPLLYLLVFEPMRRGILRREEAARTLRETQEHLRRAVRATDTLYSALHAARGALDEAALVQVVAEVARSGTDAEFGAVAIRQPAAHRIRHFVTAGFPVELAPAGVLPEGRGLLAALMDGEVVHSDDAVSDPRCGGLPSWHPPIRSFLGVPITIQGEHWGEIYVANRRDGGGFGDDDEANLRSLATFLSYGVEQSDAHARLTSSASAKMTADLGAGMAHEINNAMLSVRINLEEMRAGGAEHHDIAKMAADSLRMVDRVTALVRRLLDASHVGAATGGGRVNVADLLRAAATGAHGETPAAGPIAVAAPAELWLDGRPASQITFVLGTLLRWCARRVAAGDGAAGDAFAGAAPSPGGGATVEVGHHGSPIREKLETIFEPQYRQTAAAGGRMEYELDLMLACAAVRAAAGRIDAAPGAGGRGIAFRVEFQAPGTDVQ